ncbi:MAG: hypothetical protein JWM14_3395 [Chitinophagaceae bacterium]|nr:hypothetical protein [Chitinophagaceae bacterium]
MNQILDSTRFNHTDTVIYFMENFIRYKSNNSLETYDLYVDSTGKFNELIGVAIVYKEYDDKGRELQRIGYGLDGKYYFWDYSAIIKTNYFGDSTIRDYYNRNNKLTDRIITVVDKQGRTICLLEYDHFLKLHAKTTHEYNTIRHEVVTKYWDNNNKLKPNFWGVCIHIEKFDPISPDSKTEEYFYNEKKKLVDGDHEGLSRNSGFRFKYSQIKKRVKDAEDFFLYYDSKGNLVCEKDQYGSITF